MDISHVNNIDYVTSQMAEKDFTTTVDIDYRGDFSNIKTSFRIVRFESLAASIIITIPIAINININTVALL